MPMTSDVQQDKIETLTTALAQRDASLKIAQLTIDKLKLELTYLRRMQYARANEKGGCNCTACGNGLRVIGQDVSEVLDYEPGNFLVIRHVRPKMA